jgi:hypothetical protein
MEEELGPPDPDPATRPNKPSQPAKETFIDAVLRPTYHDIKQDPILANALGNAIGTFVGGFTLALFLGVVALLVRYISLKYLIVSALLLPAISGLAALGPVDHSTLGLYSQTYPYGHDLGKQQTSGCWSALC